ncbi:MAG: VWA domain-containing protein [Desulfobulbaceae bacterium]|nr:VWA domain-containing protein [Desulfobulbaceae bacterium]
MSNPFRTAVLCYLLGIAAITITTLAVCGKSHGAEPAATNLQGYGLKIFRVESGLYPFVHVYIRTYDQNMDPLLNLNKMNIGMMVKGRVYDPAKNQYMIQPLRKRGEAVRTVLVIDTSKTMKGNPFEAALRAAARFIDAKRSQDQVAIIALDDNSDGYTIVSNFERDYGTLGRRLADLNATGEKTRLYDGVAAAMELTAGSGPGSESLGEGDYIVSSSIVVLSDGNDEDSAISRSDLMTRISTMRLPIPIFSIAFSRVDEKHQRNLQALSRNTFGKFYYIGKKYDNITRNVEDIQNVLQSDYVLTFRAYVPVDGEEHSLKVGIEYPSGSGKMRYDAATFESLEPPPMLQILAAQDTLDRALPNLEGKSPYMVNPYTVDQSSLVLSE